MTRTAKSGFTLIEMVIVLLVSGMVVAMSVKGFSRYSDDMALKGAINQITAAMLQTRNRAMVTRTSQTMKFQTVSGSDYHVEIGGVTTVGWKLPTRVSYSTTASGTITSVTLTPDGRCSTSGLVILQNTRGLTDTVSILSSGLVRPR